MKVWNAILAAVIIFVAGAASGVLGWELYNRRSTPPVPAMIRGGPRMPWMAQRVEFMRRLSRRLELTPQQRQRINTMIRQSQQRIHDLWQTVEPKAVEELRRVHKEIESELTPKQRARFNALIRERRQQHHPRGPYRRRREPPPRGDADRPQPPPPTNHPSPHPTPQ